MPRPPENPDVKASKGLAYILRHGAEKEGLSIRSDGYIRLADVLDRPKMREVDQEMVLRLVIENSKQRFQLLYGYDPSPPKPQKLKKGQTPKKIRPQFINNNANDKSNLGSLMEEVEGKSDCLTPLPLTTENKNKNKDEGDVAEIDSLQFNLSKTSLKGQYEEYVELPLISLPIPENSEISISASTENKQPKGEYFIRATQGHSINLKGTEHLEELKNDEQGKKKSGIMVHGTKAELLNILKINGLSKMSRQHIHLAPSHKGLIIPRLGSTLFIYLSLNKLIENQIPVYVSLNGVVLTPGNQNGIIPKEFWRKVIIIQKGKKIVIWEEGKEVEREANDDEEGL
ncbi:uncharacterized protein I206_107377 [Kwoniella pini CBS 10737]|uniref:2'-phosphotransferase n=1 Tax=Kwoniella pini CBS 10737 TaxID=1296096 RepID=A0A1B9HX44_9TREE|nr:uncharacterized protein I206_05703 [Kwoniella pini CBS 10737]OCF47843.1 hypothetical protein I206_05703 [Kwoniella pini CBS 10737]